MLRLVLVLVTVALLAACELFHKADETVQSARFDVGKVTAGIDQLAAYARVAGPLPDHVELAIAELKAAVVRADGNNDGVVQGWAETPLVVAAGVRCVVALLGGSP